MDFQVSSSALWFIFGIQDGPLDPPHRLRLDMLMEPELPDLEAPGGSRMADRVRIMS